MTGCRTHASRCVRRIPCDRSHQPTLRAVLLQHQRHGRGAGDEEAAAFVEGKLPNPYAYFAAFHPDGRFIRATEIYADKDDVFRFLVELLEELPEYADLSDEGDGDPRAGARAPMPRSPTSSRQLAWTRSWAATTLRWARYRAVGERVEAGDRAPGCGVARHCPHPSLPGETGRPCRTRSTRSRVWTAAAESTSLPDVAVEQAHLTLASDDHTTALAELEEYLAASPRTARLAELHIPRGGRLPGSRTSARARPTTGAGSSRTLPDDTPGSPLLHRRGARGHALSQPGAGRVQERSSRRQHPG